MAIQNINFRVAVSQDAPQLKKLIETAFRAEDSRPEWTADMGLSASFSVDINDILSRIDQPDKAFIIAYNDKNPFIATVSVAKFDDVCRLALLAVDPNEQSGGIGRQVIAHGEQYCQKTWNVTKFGLNALCTREKLIEWYIRQGYHKNGQVTPFPPEFVPEGTKPEELFFVELSKEI